MLLASQPCEAYFPSSIPTNQPTPQTPPHFNQKGIYCQPNLTQPSPPKHAPPLLTLWGLFPPSLSKLSVRQTDIRQTDIVGNLI